MDQQQPQWSPPPQQPTGWGGPGYGGPPPRPTGVTLAAIFLIVIGVLLLLAGVLALAGGAMFANMFQGQDGGLLTGVFAFIGVIILFWAILHLVGGIGSLQGKGWGRWTGIVVAVITVIFAVLGLLGSMGRTDAGGLIYQVVIIALYALTAWVLIQASAYFAAARR